MDVHRAVQHATQPKARRRHAAQLVLGLCLLASIGLGTPRAAGAASGPLRIDLYRPGDFVSQTNLVQCVGASMQMMQNIVRTRDDRTAATQKRLFDLAVALGDPTFQRSGGVRGATAQGWAAGLNTVGLGPYRVVAVGTLDQAVALAARAIRNTGRPVGLLVWQGAHAWVMSGFEATGDPLVDAAARITAVRVLDPLYPRPGGAWGATPAPDSRLTAAQLARVFVPYRPHGRNTALRGQYVLVLPSPAPRLVGSRPQPI